jgi:hypothetical protein
MLKQQSFLCYAGFSYSNLLFVHRNKTCFAAFARTNASPPKCFDNKFVCHVKKTVFVDSCDESFPPSDLLSFEEKNPDSGTDEGQRVPVYSARIRR